MFTLKILPSSYQLSESGLYKVPLDPTKNESIEYIKSFPLTSHPEVFGMHENADIMKSFKETNNVSTLFFVLVISAIFRWVIKTTIFSIFFKVDTRSNFDTKSPLVGRESG
jgi:hypothetical protein